MRLGIVIIWAVGPLFHPKGQNFRPLTNEVGGRAFTFALFYLAFDSVSKALRQKHCGSLPGHTHEPSRSADEKARFGVAGRMTGGDATVGGCLPKSSGCAYS